MIINELHIVIFLPVLAGLLFFLIPERHSRVVGVLSILVALVNLVYSFLVYFRQTGLATLELGQGLFRDQSILQSVLSQAEQFSLLNVDGLSKLIVLSAGFITLVISVYSLGYLLPKTRPRHYFSYFLITAGCSNGAVLADHLLLFVFFWGILGLTLYKLIKGHNSITASTAKKTLIMIGASDGIMILGLALILGLGFPLSITGMDVPTSNMLGVVAFFCLLIGAFTKAGAFPFHTWVPDFSTHAPASSSAFLPASLDKLLGIYFLARLFNHMFVVAGWITLAVLIAGVATILIGVMMALAQHNYKRLLGYHAVSQVGYMITGLALGSPIGLAGGLFHMVNNALYKSGLFLSAGHIERQTGRHLIGDLGGLSRVMPLTFFAVVVFSLSIAGIPPLNGFASKWLIYQGIIQFGEGEGLANQLWVVWLAFAMFGSALTLASFVKFLSGIFLGPIKPVYQSIREKNPLLWLPQAVLAVICIVFGVFSYNWVIPKIIGAASGSFSYIGVWESPTVSLLVLISIVLGLIIYRVMGRNNIRVDEPFILGEPAGSKAGFESGEFYKTITANESLKAMYRGAEQKYFDLYEIARTTVLGLSKGLSWLHSGILPVYLIWMIAGLILMLVVFL
ncbi:MAG: proton-conducting transporter membrane subunit [Bacteroidales bacterium]